MTDHHRARTRPAPIRSLSAIMSERRQLINLAYRLLGSLAEAEDVVQETYARWYAMSRQQQEAIESPGAWLTTVASRICLDLLGSARARRERYVGEWIPEPLPEPYASGSGRSGGAAADPADRVTLDESVNMAFLVVLESMTPAERVAFILHDVFRYSFAEVAEIVGRTPAACRQLASSARRRIRASAGARDPAARQAGIVRDFKQAWEAKDIDALIGLLDPDATAIADGGGLRQRHAPPDRRRRADRALPRRHRRPGARRRDDPGAHGQRPARPGRPARRRHRDGVRVRHRGRPDQAHLGGTQPRQAPALDGGLTSAVPQDDSRDSERGAGLRRARQAAAGRHQRTGSPATRGRCRATGAVRPKPPPAAAAARRRCRHRGSGRIPRWRCRREADRTRRLPAQALRRAWRARNRGNAATMR